MIVGEQAGVVTFHVTPAISDFLWESRVFFSFRPGKAKLKPGARINVPQGVIVEPYVTFNAGGWVTPIRAHSYTNSDIEGRVSIGRHCSIGPGLRLSGFEHPISALTTGLLAYDRSVTQITQSMKDVGVNDMPVARSKRPSGVQLGHDVWVGSDVWIRQGIKIGTGAVVAANAVVTKDVPAYAIVGGNPARILRPRFPAELADRLLASEWWRLDLATLSRFPVTDAAAFMQAYSEAGGADLPAWEPKQIRLEQELRALS